MTLEQPGDAARTLAIRERLLASLVADGSTVLTRYDPAVVELHLSSGAEIVLLLCPPDPGELRPVLQLLLKRGRPGTIHVIVVGGAGSDVVPAIKKASPFWSNPKSGVDHIDPTGAVTRVAGIACRPFKQAVEELATREPLGDEQLAALVTEGARQRREVSRLAETLQGGLPRATIALGAVSVLLFALGMLWSSGLQLATLDRMGANSGAKVMSGELWRLFSSAFLYANVVHLVVNMVALASFGIVLEKLLGVRRYVILYGLAALGGSLASALLRDGGASVGASGAIWGLMTARLALALRPRGLLPPLSLAQARRTMAIPVGLNIMISLQPGIDLYAHFGGGIVGFALMWSGLLTRGVQPIWTEAPSAAPAEPTTTASALTLGAGLLSIAMAGSVALALATGRPWELLQPPVLERVRVGDTGLELDLPSSFGAPVIEAPDGYQLFRFGDFSGDPIVVELVVNVLPQAVAPEDLAAFLDKKKASAELGVPREAVVLDGPRLVTVGGYPFVAVAHRIKTITLRSWISAFGDRELLFRVYALPELPASWAGVADRIVASLRHPMKREVPPRPTLPP